MTDKSVHDATEEWVRHSITKEFTPIDINDVYKAFAAGARWQSQQAQVEPFAYCHLDVNGKAKELCSAPCADDDPRDTRTVQALYKHPPSPSAVPDEAFNIIEGIRAELTWGGWRSAHSRDWVMDSLSELLSMLTASPAPEHIKDTLGMVKHIPDAGELVEDLADSLDYFIGWYEEDADLGNGPAFKFYDKAKKAITKYRQQEEAER